jgi:hypothetical protein
MQLVTRADWDGLVCAVLLGKVEKIDGIFFAHPKDVQDGKLPVPKGSIIANLPYHPHCAMWFDHHVSEEDQAEKLPKFTGKYGLAPSAARLIYDYYGGAARFPEFGDLLQATDKIDSAQLALEDVTRPAGYVLLSYTIDPRTGLTSSRHQPYFLTLVELLQFQKIDEILQFPEVRKRCERVLADDSNFRQTLQAHSRQEDNLVITDFRGLTDLPSGNRFLIYALFPKSNISLRLFDGRGGAFTVAALGHSIFNRTSQTNIGELLARYGGGGHRGAGTAQFPQAEADAKIAAIVAQLKKDG